MLYADSSTIDKCAADCFILRQPNINNGNYNKFRYSLFCLVEFTAICTHKYIVGESLTAFVDWYELAIVSGPSSRGSNVWNVNSMYLCVLMHWDDVYTKFIQISFLRSFLFRLCYALMSAQCLVYGCNRKDITVIIVGCVDETNWFFLSFSRLCTLLNIQLVKRYIFTR